MEFQFPKTSERTLGYCLLLMLSIIGDKHHRNMLQGLGSLDLSKNLHPIAVIDVELAIDQDQVDGLTLEDREGVGPLIGSEYFDVEMFAEHRRDGRMVRTAIADIENGAYWHD